MLVLIFIFALALLVNSPAPAAEPPALVVQSDQQQEGRLVSEGAAGARQPNAQFCSHCYQQLQRNNRDCESLKGQDWQVCREAANLAYRQCGQEC
jgi:hypothetical protein